MVRYSTESLATSATEDSNLKIYKVKQTQEVALYSTSSTHGDRMMDVRSNKDREGGEFVFLRRI